MDFKVCKKCQKDKPFQEYRQNNPEIKAKHSANRRALKNKSLPKWLTPHHLEEIEKIYKTSVDLKNTNSLKYEVDHIIPLKHKSVCGLHVPWNLQILTESDNRIKHN